jgi:hypothetical protein
MRKSVGPLYFCDDKWIATGLGRDRTDGFDVGCALDKGLAHRINALAERELQTDAIMFGEGADTKVNPGQIEPFA